MEKKLFKFQANVPFVPLSWLNWVTSHSVWEASNIKTFKTSRFILVTDYHIWPVKLFEYLIILAGKLENFVDTPQQIWLHGCEYSRWEWVVIFQMGIFWVGIFRGASPGWEFDWWEFSLGMYTPMKTSTYGMELKLEFC